jgi:hypothetical protein
MMWNVLKMYFFNLIRNIQQEIILKKYIKVLARTKKFWQKYILKNSHKKLSLTRNDNILLKIIFM